ncbi:unnamed protein product [Aphanomyces euteiches]
MYRRFDDGRLVRREVRRLEEWFDSVEFKQLDHAVPGGKHGEIAGVKHLCHCAPFVLHFKENRSQFATQTLFFGAKTRALRNIRDTDDLLPSTLVELCSEMDDVTLRHVEFPKEFQLLAS